MQSKKHQVIEKLFLGLRSFDNVSDVLPFNNEQVKQLCTEIKFRNPFDATKFNDFRSMSESLKKDGFFIVHLGRGNHAFVKGNRYHSFEKISTYKTWNSIKSVVSELGKSEADTVSSIYNTKIIHDFLFSDSSVNLMMHVSRRTNVTYEFSIGHNTLQADWLQIELDGFFESDSTITSVEVKSVKHDDFEIRQLYSTLMYFRKCVNEKKISSRYKLKHLFVVESEEKGKKFYRLYEYQFKDWRHMDSIELIKNAQYNIV